MAVIYTHNITETCRQKTMAVVDTSGHSHNRHTMPGCTPHHRIRELSHKRLTVDMPLPGHYKRCPLHNSVKACGVKDRTSTWTQLHTGTCRKQSGGYPSGCPDTGDIGIDPQYTCHTPQPGIKLSHLGRRRPFLRGKLTGSTARAIQRGIDVTHQYHLYPLKHAGRPRQVGTRHIRHTVRPLSGRIIE